jgi:hypothetical protein
MYIGEYKRGVYKKNGRYRSKIRLFRFRTRSRTVLRTICEGFRADLASEFDN